MKLSLLLSSLFLLLTGCANQSPPQPRPGPAYDGSAHWARDIAQPLIAQFAADASIYNIQGIQTLADGRLPLNAGRWSLQAWSPSRQEELQVIVRPNGSTSSDVRAQATPPSSDGQPIPAGWVNSTDVFNAIAPHREAGQNVATLTVFNLPTYSAPNWGVDFGSGAEPEHFVRWDGTYLGTSP